MLLSKLFPKTSKTITADSESINAKLLTQAGFIDQEMAGVYSWLPLGLRVLRKVENIIREEMNALGAQELLMPGLQSKEHWDATGRFDAVDVLFKLNSQTGKTYALGPTHEEVITPLVQKFVKSYKDLPLALYQIQTKFRDELRAKSGVLRGREFGMKDLYSFHTTREDLEVFYAQALQAYLKVFKRCGLKVKVVEASGGTFTKKFSHEFQVVTPAGEDGLSPAGESIVVVGKHLSERGLGFFYQQPLPHRRMIASLEGQEAWAGFLINITWCRFTRHGWYESGGRFLQAVPAPVPQHDR